MNLLVDYFKNPEKYTIIPVDVKPKCKIEFYGEGLIPPDENSNFTFEVWMILHKSQCNNCAHRRQYVRQINACYNEHFENLKQYKKDLMYIMSRPSPLLTIMKKPAYLRL